MLQSLRSNIEGFTTTGYPDPVDNQARREKETEQKEEGELSGDEEKENGKLVFREKLPGGSIPTARRLISGERLFLFWFESPGGDGSLPGDATLFAFFLGCFEAVRAEIIVTYCVQKSVILCSSVRRNVIGVKFGRDGFIRGMKSLTGMGDSAFRWALMYRLAVLGLPPGDSESRGCSMKFWQPCTRLSGRSARRWHLTVSGYRQAVWNDFAWRRVHGWWLTCDDMSEEVHIQLLSRGDTSEVRRAGLRAGRFVEQDYERGGYNALGLRSWPITNSPFLFGYGDDRVIRYTGADVDTGDVEDVQATETLAPDGEWIPPGGLERFRLAACRPSQAEMLLSFVHGWWLTCDDMSEEDHIQLLSRGDTSEVGSYVPYSCLRDATCGEVRGWWITCVELWAGRSGGQDYERGGYNALGLSSPFLFVYGDDRVIRYTGADVDTGDVEDVQATE
ncbi:hypothetical protein DEO72_LG4g1408 [Vigna unguiculata]|uniref:Uncharacterized protein n=1 Tax=Vigna unguiculata TaxID=3917 RepID=A0A4D6LNI8_VIGUN|nr:hypothetical protein DEO72_LG4g1408 [Vigna unguiculata]